MPDGKILGLPPVAQPLRSLHRGSRMNKRVLLLSVTGDRGYGAERVLATLVDALPGDFAPRCVLLRPPASSLARWAVGPRAPQRDWPASRDAAIHNSLACLRAARELRTEGIGLVHAWGARAFDPALLLGKLLGARVSGTLHDHPRATFLGRVRRTIIKRSAQRFTPLVCVSHALAEACRDAGWHGEFIVIHNGLTSAPARAVNRHNGAVRVGFFGLYSAWKGFDTIRRWVGDADSAVEWHFYGEPAPSLRAACDELQGRRLSNVVFHGWEDAAGLMDGIDVVLHASVEFDPYPTVLLEAARAGIPAVASSLGGSQEIVANGITGFLFSPDDSAKGLKLLRRLASDPALRRSMGVAARRKFETELGVGRMVDAYLAVWNAGLTRDVVRE